MGQESLKNKNVREKVKGLGESRIKRRSLQETIPNISGNLQCVCQKYSYYFSAMPYLKSFISVHCFSQVVITFIYLSNIIIMDSPELPSESTFLFFLVQDPHIDTIANILVSTTQHICLIPLCVCVCVCVSFLKSFLQCPVSCLLHILWKTYIQVPHHHCAW